MEINLDLILNPMNTSAIQQAKQQKKHMALIIAAF